MICVPIFGFVTAAPRGPSATGEPRCNWKQMQSLIMQSNVHHFASLIARHQQRAYRTYGAVQGIGETLMQASRQMAAMAALKMHVKVLFVTQMND